MTAIPNSTDIDLSGLKSEMKHDVNSFVKVDETKKDQTVKAERVSQQESEDITYSKPLNSKQLEKVAQQLQDFVGELNRNLEFSVDKDSGRDVIKVFDKGTGDLIKQFPSEEVLTLVSKLSEMVGGFVNTKV
ncbi:MAG: flagellar protein FlaG [Colwellia sp.]|jgi:flagellar protein FlaG